MAKAKQSVLSESIASIIINKFDKNTGKIDFITFGESEILVKVTKKLPTALSARITFVKLGDSCHFQRRLIAPTVLLLDSAETFVKCAGNIK